SPKPNDRIREALMALRAIALLSLAGAISLAQAAPITRVPASEVRDAVTSRNVPVKMLLNGDTPAFKIELGAVKADEAAKAVRSSKAQVSRTGKPRPRPPSRVGIGRAVPGSLGTIALADLSWEPVAGNGTAARVIVTSDRARALRLGLRIDGA